MTTFNRDMIKSPCNNCIHWAKDIDKIPCKNCRNVNTDATLDKFKQDPATYKEKPFLIKEPTEMELLEMRLQTVEIELAEIKNNPLCSCSAAKKRYTNGLYT